MWGGIKLERPPSFSRPARLQPPTEAETRLDCRLHKEITGAGAVTGLREGPLSLVRTKSLAPTTRKGRMSSSLWDPERS